MTRHTASPAAQTAAQTAAQAAPGRLLLITGGSRGIGAACARLAAAQGWAVALSYQHAHDAALGLVDELRCAGARAAAYALDVGDAAQIERCFAQIDADLQMGRVFAPGTRWAALVNNAGVVDVAARVDAMRPARLARMFQINVVGSMLCAAQAVLRLSTRHGGPGGAIVNVSSAASRVGSPGQYVDYAASKAAIDTFTLGLAKEVAAEGVRVNAVRPGIIDTEIHASGGQPERAAQMAPHLPMQRVGTADEVAQSILWLLSPQASYVTGAVLDVAGGR